MNNSIRINLLYTNSPSRAAGGRRRRGGGQRMLDSHLRCRNVLPPVLPRSSMALPLRFFLASRPVLFLCCRFRFRPCSLLRQWLVRGILPLDPPQADSSFRVYWVTVGADQSEALANRCAIKDLLTPCGLLFNDAKDADGQRLVYLGVLFDTVAMTLSFEPEKAAALRTVLVAHRTESRPGPTFHMPKFIALLVS